ncbi:energy transducer TonB [Maribacter sp. BPC-D8]|uniref:energy transducer TonB n=1 Tax=Maribacter sp. BPC-D8 TaxID=3053613 RepID=UPI002B48B1FF|nr:energy transducer TonB [Maribacter sp. BPC-D8]WRI28262.1 energy transducer TonB [Maribacter sp. BPC-D8]
MIQYILECIAFQLLFLVIYDFFLKKETFFQWNRVYLIGTFVLSLILPWIKIEAFKQQVPPTFAQYPEYLWGLQNTDVVVQVQKSTGWNVTWQEGVLYGGMLVALLLFGLKIRQLYLLRKSGEKISYPLFTQVVIANSNIAFSFFKSIFIGDKVLKMKHDTIIAHELVHIKQRHTYDLLFFEFMRIVGWFNPLVYVYQNRISELHEFIADAQVSKEHKTDHYEQLLAQVFQTEHISFINQFFTQSLIKKRIIMLQKSKSKKVWQLKYLLLLPMVLGMLLYSSCEMYKNTSDGQGITRNDELLIAEVKAKIEEDDLGMHYLYNSSLAEKRRDMNQTFTKNEYFLYEVLQNKILEEELKSYIKKNPDESIKLALVQPSTELYNDFVNQRKAYKLIDVNLKASVKAFEKGIFYYNNNFKVYPSDYLEFKVKNTAELSSNELQKFNELLIGLENESYHLTNIILHDDQNSFLIKTNIKDLMKSKESSDIQFVSEEGFSDFDNVDVPFAVVDEVPVFPGCEDADDKRACFNEKMQQHIGKHFSYPQAAQDANIQGRVSTMFIISSEGTIENIKMRGPDKLLEDEVARIIKSLPKMIPGKQSGKAVNVPFSIPIQFKLDDSDSSSLDEKTYMNENDVPFAVVDEVPIFPGCEDADDNRACFNEKMQQHIGKYFNYPKAARDANIEGRVSAMFLITSEGAIENIKMRGPDKLLEDEVERIIKRLPKMIPGKQSGKAVNVPFSIPVNFKLKSESTNEKAINLNSNDSKGSIYLINGEVVEKHEYDKMDADKNSIERILHLGPEASIKKYGKVAENGSYEIITKNNNSTANMVSEISKESELEPMYYVDDIKITKLEMEAIDPNTIESIFILKDEKAIEKYGEVGENGVVEIRIKKE